MRLQRTWAVRRGCAVVLASALAASPVVAVPAFAETAQAPAAQQAATGAATAKNATAKDVAAQNAEATTQADLDNAAEGSPVELKGTITQSLHVNKKLTLTAAEGAVMKADLTINANDVTVSGVHFTLDGTTGKANSIICNGKTGLTVKGCTLDITNDADKLNGQLSSVWLGNGADNATFDGNTFNTCLAGVDWSYVGINISGPSVKNTTVSNNKVSFGKSSSSNPGSVYFVMANGNSQTAGDYNVSGLKVSGNKIGNDTGLASGKSKTLGIGVANASDVSIEGNTFDSLYLGVSAPSYPKQPSGTKSLALTNNTFADCFAGMMMGTGDVEPGAVVSTRNDFGKTQLPYFGDGLVWQSEDAHLYPKITDAASAGKTSLALTHNLNLGSAANVDDGQDVTIDLNGHKLNGSLSNFGNLTIKDSAGSDGAVSSIEIDGTGTTTIAGGTYDSNPYDKGFYGENSGVADGYGTLVRVREDDGTYKYTVLPKDDVLAKATAKTETENGKLFFEKTEDATAYAEKNGLPESDVKPAKYTVSFDTDGNGKVDPITVESGESVTLPAVPEREGYKDGAWHNGDQKVEGEFTPTADVTLSAKWVKDTGNGSNGSNGSNGNNGANGSNGSNGNNGSGNGNSSLPATGDDAAAVVATAAVAGVAAVGAGIATRKRRNDA